MSLCKTIETLSMAYLDDELAPEERHELEAHLIDCANCRAQLEAERADLSMVRRALVAPPASDMLRSRISRALDEEDRVRSRRRWSHYLLPGSAMVAAAAAIAVFVGVQAPTSRPKVAASAVHDAVKAGRRALPLEVEGPGTTPWLQQHFASDVAPPQFGETSSEPLGGRLLPGGINGHDGALLRYQISIAGHPPFELDVLIVRDLQDDDLRGGDPVRVNGRTLYVYNSDSGSSVVTYAPRPGMGFMFMAPELTVNELLGLVSKANLVTQ